MRIATWNINNVNLRLPLLLAWLDATRPDVVALQELKSTVQDFPARELELAGYGAQVVGQKTWNGVALLARGAEPVLVRNTLPGDPADRQARYVEAAVDGVIVTSLYAPNGNPWPGAKFDYKLAWFDRLVRHAVGLFASGHPVVLAGDYNVVPSARDIYVSSSWDSVERERRATYGHQTTSQCAGRWRPNQLSTCPAGKEAPSHALQQSRRHCVRVVGACRHCASPGQALHPVERGAHRRRVRHILR